MKKFQTQLQLNNAHLPTQLEFLRVLNCRGSNYFFEEKKLYKSIQAGTEGEQKLLQYLIAFGKVHWVGLQNIWLKDFQTFECDTVLITNHCIYIFEVKNYRGTFAYKEGKCFFNSIESPLNPFEQVRANAASLRNYLKRLNIHIPVKAAVVFTGQDNEIHIHSEIKDIEVVQSTGIRNFILRVIEEENRSPQHSLAPDYLIKQLEKIETSNPYMPSALSEPSICEIRSGICCGNCFSFRYKRSKFKIHCDCGIEEKIEHAALRTIKDYSILHYDRPISRIELMKFFNDEIGLSFLRKILDNNFTKVTKVGLACYEINRKKIERLISLLPYH